MLYKSTIKPSECLYTVFQHMTADCSHWMNTIFWMPFFVSNQTTLITVHHPKFPKVQAQIRPERETNAH